MATTSYTTERAAADPQGRQYFSSNATQLTPSEPGLDRDWVKRAFLLSDTNLQYTFDVKNRYWAANSVKFTDTSLGGNIGINAKPQFTRYSDPPNRRLSVNKASIYHTTGGEGMGRYYSEAIDDPAQTIYLRCGVPQFNGMLSFLSRAYSAQQMTLAKTGRGIDFFHKAGEVVGMYIRFVAFPIFTITITAIKQALSLVKTPLGKYYTLKPTMHNYWSAVQFLVNTVAVNMGILPKLLADDESQRLGRPYTLDQEYLEQLSSYMPHLFRDGNYFDIYAIASHAQVKANSVFMAEFEALNNGSYSDMEGYLKKRNEKINTYIANGEKDKPTFGAWINKVLSFGYYQSKPSDPNTTTELDPRVNTGSPDEANDESKESYFKEFLKFFDAEFREGSQFAVFKVDYTGATNESFSNAATESKLSQNLNSTVSDFRDIRFSLSDGNLGLGAIGDMASSVFDSISGFASGAVNSITFGASDSILGILKGIAGNAFIDIPQHWQSSNASFPKATYKMKLISPYGNAFSRMQNIIIPLCMVLAMVLPLATGKASYQSPFLVQLYDRGRVQIQTGLVRSVSITRGTSNLGYNIHGSPLAIDVSMDIMDLSSIMHMPIASNPLDSSFDTTIDQDNPLVDYLAVLAGQDIYSQIYPMQRARLNFAKKLMNGKRLFSPAFAASLMHDVSVNAPILSLFGNTLEGLVAGSSVVAGSTSAGRN